jgi:predicted nucleotidyltransferase
MKLRDRDAIITKEGLILRVFGYTHPANCYFCDPEYSPAALFKSADPRAIRSDGSSIWYKFYDEEGWKLVESNFPRYMVCHEMLGRRVIGVNIADIGQVRRPEVILRRRLHGIQKDSLTLAMKNVIEQVCPIAGLCEDDFGVFGSMLHGFHNPDYSDIDLIIYGADKLQQLREALANLYDDSSSRLSNEFQNLDSIVGKNWRFRNLSQKEYLWHQRRKSIYGLFQDDGSHRAVKTEFEPVKAWHEITNDYDATGRIDTVGWVKILAKVRGDADAAFIPSIYEIKPVEIVDGPREALEAVRVVSFLEEFRMQALRDESVYIEGNLEKVSLRDSSFSQVTLTYCPRYYEQVVKIANNSVTW